MGEGNQQLNLVPWLCYGGVEVSNHYRTATYVENVGVTFTTMGTDCACPQLDEGFTTPTDDPAPWYEPTRPESADFFGFFMNAATLQPVMERNVEQNGRRSSLITPLITKGRIMQCQGLMIARSQEGQEFGERWLASVLRGSPCNDDGCPTDDAVYLPACPEMEGYDETRYFRTLVDVGIVDGPVFTPVIKRQYLAQQASFVLVSSQPWIYHPATRCIDHDILADYYAVDTLSCPLTVPEWMGDGTFRIELENTGATDAVDITIRGQISLDGTCPVSGLGSSVPYSWVYTIPTLASEDKLVIDGARRKVQLYDASDKFWSNGYSSLDFTGPWKWPDVGPCTTMCLSLDIVGGEVTTTVDSYLREL